MKDQIRLSSVQNGSDPLSDLVQLLWPAATIWSRIDARGRWGVSFRQRNDLLFCWMESGECQLLRPDAEPLFLRQHDFTFVRTGTLFSLASGPDIEPVDSETIIASAGHTNMSLGDADGGPVVLRGGRFVFDTANEELLIALLPQVMLLRSDDPMSSQRLKALLMMNAEESAHPAAGSHFFVSRLMELILLETLRNAVGTIEPEQTGLLAGLSDTIVARVLATIHGAPSRSWTIDALAQRCGLSRSGLSHRFGAVMGIGPIEYLQRWRIAVAKDYLRFGQLSIGEIALKVGFQSSSAFSTAFSRTVGCSAKQFRAARERHKGLAIGPPDFANLRS